MATKDKDTGDIKKGIGKMKRHYTEEIKKEVCRRLCQGEPPLKIAEETGINKNTIYYWQNNCSYMQDYRRTREETSEYCKKLEAYIEKLEKENESLRYEKAILEKAFSLVLKLEA